MPTKTYPFEEEGPDRLELSWRGSFKDFTVTLDGLQLNTESWNRKQIQDGQRIELPDGSKLLIKQERNFFGNELRVVKDGKPLPGSGSHPATRAKTASIILFVVAGFTALFVIALYASENSFDSISGVTVLIYLGLGLLVRRGSLVALWVGIILFGLDSLLWVGVNFAAGEFPILFILIRVLLIGAMVRAIPAMKQLKALREESVIT